MKTNRLVALALPTLLLAAHATPTPWPVAISLPDTGGILIETYWNLTVGIDVSGEPGPVECDVVVETAAPVLRVPRAVDLVSISLFDVDGAPEPFDFVLDRRPNALRPVLRPFDPAEPGTAHAVRLRSLPTGKGEAPALLIEVTGVKIVIPTKTRSAPADFGPVDAVIVRPAGDLERAQRLAVAFRPRHLFLAHHTYADRAGVISNALEEAHGQPVAHRALTGRTLAVARASDPSSAMTIVTPAAAAWTMPPDMAEWFARKEAECRRAQDVFRPLSVRQMNHRPSNGTHTPRWNVEHMMGRELGFFSSIYANRDPELKAIDLNPAQMPPDYVAAHPDWTGEEEARQMERVIRFTRRFADRLDGSPLSERPKGSPWTLERLLAQMERHWGEHTANVEDKFQLPDWPAE